MSTIVDLGIPALELGRGNAIGFRDSFTIVARCDLIVLVAVVDNAGHLGSRTGTRVFGRLGRFRSGCGRSRDVYTDIVV